MQLSSGTHYILEQRIAEGGMGSVYRGTLHSPAGRRTVAIKRLLATKQVSEDARLRLTTEARLVFRLNHANVCQVLDLGSDGNEIYVIMEYVQGLDLGRLLQWHRRSGTRLETAHAIYIAREVARALDYAHRRTGDHGALLGLVHGDVTPANILLSVEGEVKLSDFGIARAAIASPGQQLRGGTPGYMAPEAERAIIDHRADLYSLGATLWSAIVGRRAGQTIDVAALEEIDGVSPELRAMVANMLAIDPARRPVSAGAVETSLATELSRRHPGFTPGMLGALVAAASVDDTVIDQPALGTLVSIVEQPASDAPRHTQTVALGRRARRRRVVLPVTIALVGAVGVAIVVALWRIPDRATASDSAISIGEHVVMASVDAAVTPAHAADAAAAEPPSPLEPKHPVRTPDHRAQRAKPTDTNQALGLLTVTSEPWGAVYVDDVRVAAETPAYQLHTRAGKHEVKVFYPDRGTFSPSRTITVVPGKVVAVGFKK